MSQADKSESGPAADLHNAQKLVTNQLRAYDLQASYKLQASYESQIDKGVESC